MAVGYATLTTLVLCCSPRVKDTILSQWICQDEVSESAVEESASVGFPAAEDSVSVGFPVGESAEVDETLSIGSSDPPEPVKKTWL